MDNRNLPNGLARVYKTPTQPAGSNNEGKPATGEENILTGSEQCQPTEERAKGENAMQIMSSSFESPECGAQYHSHIVSSALHSNQSSIDRTAELERANAELRVMLQQREDFVVALTQNLKNPLIGAMRILECLMTGQISAEQQPEIFSQMIDSNKSMLRMIWNLLDVYRDDSGSLVTVKETVDVSELLHECLEEFSFTIKSKELNVETKIGDNVLMIQTDRTLLRRVLINLLDNGVKFSPKGGRLMVDLACSEKELTLLVRDSGRGMTDEQQGRMFQRFWQTKANREYSTGTGLGLFLCKQIVELLGGTIECVSAIDQGAQFTVKLPLVQS